MNTNEIERLLQVVSPSLVAGYETKNLAGKSLKGIYEEYKATAVKSKKSLLVLKWLVLTSIPTVSLVGIYFFTTTGSKIFSGIFIWAVCLAAFLAIDHISADILKYSRLMCQREDILKAFEQSVKALGAMTNHVYTEESVGDSLIELAVKLLHGGKKLKENTVINQSSLAVCNWEAIFDAYNCEVGGSVEFEKLLQEAEKFNLHLSKKVLFATASAKT